MFLKIKLIRVPNWILLPQELSYLSTSGVVAAALPRQQRLRSQPRRDCNWVFEDVSTTNEL